jgi:excisionase family DNA binding protein
MKVPGAQVSPHEIRVAKTRPQASTKNVAAKRAGNRKSQAPPGGLRPMAWRIDDGARLLSISRSTVYSLARGGKLKLIRVAGRTLIPHSEVVRVARKGA